MFARAPGKLSYVDLEPELDVAPGLAAADSPVLKRRLVQDSEDTVLGAQLSVPFQQPHPTWG